MNENEFIQGSLFEEDYLIRTLGNLGTQPEVALTELVANAWDAGATQVDIFIPSEKGQKLTIKDNGSGLTKDEFYARWMKLSYNRLRHQGKMVEFPKGVDLKRFAYGRNGIGRHGMLCFNTEYQVITYKNGIESTFILTTESEKQPFIIKDESFKKSNKTGTTLEVIVQKNLPNADIILDVISARFLHDPKFFVSINKKTIQLEQHKGLVDSSPIQVNDIKLQINLIDSKKSRKSTLYQGIAIWQGGRLIGEPSWILGNIMVLDGRSKEAKRYSVVVESTDLADFIKEDWTGFKKNDKLESIYEAINTEVQKMFYKIAQENIEETTSQIRNLYKKQYNDLSPLAKYEFNEAIQHISISSPTAREESISLALDTVLNLEKTRSGNELLIKLSTLSSEDIDGLNKLLENWSIKDALTVLDEIDKRISVIEAIRKLSNDSTVDELHVLHPLVASARWIFGPEYDSPEYSSNNQLQTTVEKVFGKKINKSIFNNNRKRPDIVVIGDSTFSITATTDFDHENGLSAIKRVLIIELKRGGFKLGRDERNQAVGYVEDFVNCGTLIGSPYINAYVVGESFSEKVQPIQSIENENKVEIGKVQICLFSQIVDSSERRLFNLREKLNERYADVTGIELFNQQKKLII
ncbi:ATP-binding protein [Flavobacterium defluvii]|uniref:Histidine kinase-, DNA gyrase B-, and HSP90-like ATPase n=1 Tax=Flavobacterium defluvii TaxID=370979 RepID=A0A1M5GD89_9FLAO|nr:ATP-binding protein [Flavobacterium defluvii]SHG01725.1 Histidine kinase-, DNA gyrase B-, and HSP90-like ATPase [Flavobacterium defluvii]